MQKMFRELKNVFFLESIPRILFLYLFCVDVRLNKKNIKLSSYSSWRWVANQLWLEKSAHFLSAY